MAKETEKQKLQRELAEAKAKLEKLERQEKIDIKDGAIKKLSEYTDSEKIKFFDKLYKSAESELSSTEEKGYHDEDSVHYAWEEYFSILAKDKKLFWDYFNSLT